MKKYVSLLGLWAAMTFWPCAAVCVLMAAAELFLTFIKLPAGAVYWGYQGFSYFTESLGVGKIYGFALLFMCLALYFSCRSANRLTLSRLTVSERVAAGMQALCGLCWLLALWAVQLCVFLVILARYLDALDVEFTAVTVLVNVYQSSLLHWMMPLRDWQVLLIMALLQLGLALSVAADSLAYRARGGFPLHSLIMGFVAAMCLGRRVDSEGWFGIALSAGMVGVGIYRLWAYRDTEVL